MQKFYAQKNENPCLESFRNLGVFDPLVGNVCPVLTDCRSKGAHQRAVVCGHHGQYGSLRKVTAYCEYEGNNSQINRSHIAATSPYEQSSKNGWVEESEEITVRVI